MTEQEAIHSAIEQPQTPTLHSLSVEGGIELTVSTRGAAIVGLRVPFEGQWVEPVVSYADLAQYERDPFYLGAMCGRYAGRIKDAAFRLNGEQYRISTPEDARHALHGGVDGFHQRIWTHQTDNASALSFTLESPHADQGFPGNLSVTVSYWIRRQRELVIDVEARADRDTVLNLVNHAYFNLNPDRSPIDNHHVTLFADYVTELDDELIPTGQLTPVAGTGFDLRESPERSDTPSAPESADVIHAPLNCLGSRQFDQNYALSKTTDDLGLAAIVRAPDQALQLAVHTTLPGVQLYTGDQLDGALTARSGLCLEAQQFPDAPNHSEFPSACLRRGEPFRSRTVYAFGHEHDIRHLDL